MVWRLAWKAFNSRFATPSTSRISLIKRKLQSVQQGSMSCQSFLDEVKSLSDELSAVGKPVEDFDLILSVLNGLNSSFHSFVTTYMLLAKEKSMPFSDFHAELLTMISCNNFTITPFNLRLVPMLFTPTKIVLNQDHAVTITIGLALPVRPNFLAQFQFHLLHHSGNLYPTCQLHLLHLCPMLLGLDHLVKSAKEKITRH